MSPPLLTFPRGRFGDLVADRVGIYVITLIAYDVTDQFYGTGVKRASATLYPQVIIWGASVLAR